MRFMMLVKADRDSEAGKFPDKELVAAMGRFNDEMAKAGILLAAEGLQPSSKGARVRIAGDQRTVKDGPFPEPEKLVAGYWVIQTKSKQEAVDWALRCPPPHSEGAEAEIEIRQVFEASDFPPEVLPPEEAGREQKLREKLHRKASEG